MAVTEPFGRCLSCAAEPQDWTSLPCMSPYGHRDSAGNRVRLTPHQERWVDWLLNPVGRECPDLPIGRRSGWTVAVREAALRSYDDV